jgi:CDP-glycerol glycerophosphotransferase (TagB/SpsB family)
VLRQRVRRVARRRRTRLSVVVVLGPRQDRYVEECLASLPGDAEVLVAPWGEVECAVGLRRVRVLPASATANEARNAGAAAATGNAVLFVDATETLRPGGLEALAHAVARGATVAAGAGPACTLSRLMFRREAVPTFDPAHGRFPQAALPVESELVGVDETVAENTHRVWAVPFGTVPAASAELAHFVAVLEAAVPGATWTASALEELAPAFLDDLENAADQDVKALAAVLKGLDLGAVADVETRLRLWLVAHGHHEAMSRFTAERWFVKGQFPTRLDTATVYADLPVAGVEVPPEVVEVPVELEASLRRVLADRDEVRLSVFAAVRWVDFAEHEPVITARMVHESGASVDLPVEPTPTPAASRHFRQTHQNHDRGAVEITIAPALLEKDGRWHLELTLIVDGLELSGRVTDRDERSSAAAPEWPESPDVRPARLEFDRQHGLQVVAGKAGRVRQADAPGPHTLDVRLEESASGADLLLLLSGAEPDELELVMGGRRVPATFEPADDAAFAARFALVDDPWGRGSQPLPTGTWRVACRSGRRTVDLPISEPLVGRTPLELSLGTYRPTVLRGRAGQLLIRLQPPLKDDELGPYAQQRLRSAYAVDDRPTDPRLVLFSCYAGTAATDSPRAIFDELHARHPALRCLWVVADRSVAVPDGARPVLLRSREWYAALATAGLVVTNVEMDRFFRTRPEQRLLQTFHGYPSKAMGLGLWQSKNFSPLRQEQQLANTSANWSFLLTPTPEMDRHYREQYRYDGPILNQGYPRDDALVGPETFERRKDARERLGIGDGQTAVLYAPTWRDDLATDFRAARLLSHLDVNQAAAALGNDHVFLLRGHRFHETPGSGARVLDVTAYPEINDLILAADAAVLDYSSLRFDFALTSRPMVFLVPDLEEYAGANRGFLYPFEDSAPGPLLSTTDEVVEALKDLAKLSTDYAAPLVRFNATYNLHQDGQAARRVVDALTGAVPGWDTLAR